MVLELGAEPRGVVRDELDVSVLVLLHAPGRREELGGGGGEPRRGCGARAPLAAREAPPRVGAGPERRRDVRRAGKRPEAEARGAVPGLREDAVRGAGV